MNNELNPKRHWCFSKSKVSSGRWILTLAGAFCFCYMVVTFCNILKAKSAVLEISELLPYIASILIVLSNIFTFYFTSKLNGNGKNNDEGHIRSE